jgi:hypothetical protein
MKRRRHKLQFEVSLVASQDGLPVGDSNPYRHMDEADREALLLESFVRILREPTDTPPDQPDCPSK